MSFHKYEHDHHHHHDDHHHHKHHQPKYVEEEYCSEVVQHRPHYVDQEYCEGERFYPESPAHFGHERYGYQSSNNHYKRNERLGELGALASGAFALYEESKAKKDPEHARKHHVEAGTAALGALGSGGYAYHEHRQHNKFEDWRC